ncbi:extracellular catalytic domain type 1 short-chain-length polyhydroxyalkanoate depolymerase [Variovorax sp. LT1P1]|uniref:extracellular catalytic domain type 1 short-chain-length polyhydroxyalkanoate depolymerase n=1 Tax=Variovorax sp. LT1P1 TaxID=3443730 RepID=UPI003F4516F3
MNDFLHRLGDASRQTRLGQLMDATRTIQQALLDRTAPNAARFDAADTAPVEHVAPAERAAHPTERWLDGSSAHRGRTLAYKLYVPPANSDGDSAKRPLVVMLHGCTQGAADFAAGTQMNLLAREAGALVLYPEQTQRANAQKCWNWFKPQHQQRGKGEPEALAMLIRSIVDEHDVDDARVYVAGLSAGGAMADILGRSYPDLIAAVGVHSGLPSGAASDLPSALAAMRQGAGASDDASACVPPTIVFHGDADATVHVRNATAIVDAARTSHRDPTGALPEGQASEGRAPAGRRYTRTVYTDRDGRARTEYWRLHGAGHAWSGGSAQGSYTDPTGVDASAEMLRFFLAHRLRAVIDA